MQKAAELTTHQRTTQKHVNLLCSIMEWIVLVRFLHDSNGCSCELHPFGCEYSLVLNQDDCGVGMVLRLRMFVSNELACYTIRNDGSDGCHICFTTREFAEGDNGCGLDEVIVLITQMFSSPRNLIIGRWGIFITTIVVTFIPPF